MFIKRHSILENKLYIHLMHQQNKQYKRFKTNNGDKLYVHKHYFLYEPKQRTSCFMCKISQKIRFEDIKYAVLKGNKVIQKAHKKENELELKLFDVEQACTLASEVGKLCNGSQTSSKAIWFKILSRKMEVKS